MNTISLLIICFLAACMVIFLVGISAQSIRIEKAAADTARLIEHKISKMLRGN